MLKREIVFALLEGRFEDAGVAIEAEFEKLYVMLAQRTKRIEALEKKLESIQDETCRTLGSHDQRLRSLDSRIHPLEQIVVPALLEKPVPTDKFGKPEGGLEPGDVISYWCNGREEKVRGLFSHCEKKNGEVVVMAYFRLSPFLEFMPLKDVTFEFRPKFPEKR